MHPDHGLSETFLELLGLFLNPTWSLESIRPYLETRGDDTEHLERETLQWLRWLLVHGLLETGEAADEGISGVDDVRTDEEAVRRYWFQLRPKGDEVWTWMQILEQSSYDRTVENGELIFRRRESAEIAWRGKPGGRSVRQHVPVPDSDDVVALLDRRGKASNLVRMRPDGSVVWRAQTLPPEPYFFSVSLPSGGRLRAYDGSNAVILDLATGEIVSSAFVK